MTILYKDNYIAKEATIAASHYSIFSLLKYCFL